MNQPIRRALISVSDKREIVAFAKSLRLLDIEILSTGGTATLLSEQGVAVVGISDYTGFPEMMGGRVKTLNPIIHGGILGRRGIDDNVMRLNDIQPIDLVVVNLYPFKEVTSTPDCTLELAIENIDIGGPTMLRAAAKNYNDVTVVVDVDDYSDVLDELHNQDGCVNREFRFNLSVKAFEHTVAYDGAVANYLGRSMMSFEVESQTDSKIPSPFSRTFNHQYHKKQDLRYGENPHQQAAFYINKNASLSTVATSDQIQGKALSYNNIADTDAALECVKQFDSDSACVIVKHANPCGVAVSDKQLHAYECAYSTDSESAFGGIIAFNTSLEFKTASKIIDQQFVEVIIAPEVTDEAKRILETKLNVRVLQSGLWQARCKEQNTESNLVQSRKELDFKKVRGGLLVQDMDDQLFDKLEVVTKRKPTGIEMQDLLFAWKVAKFVKSNAIIYASNQMTIGIGAGQMSRVNSVRIAAIKAEHAGLSVKGAVMASDAFFPFRDGVDNAAAMGVSAVIQPGGSMRDEEVISAADEHNIAMVYTGMRHFRH